MSQPVQALAPTQLQRRLHLLGDFLAVADSGAIRVAARQQHISQSALTRRIQELETGLGVQLFERHPHGMTMTKFGEALRHHAQLVDMTCAYAIGEINDLLGGGAGELRIAAGPAWGYTLVPDAIAALQERFPAVRVNLVNRLNETTLPMLSEGRLDVVLGGFPEPELRDSQLLYEPVLEIEHQVFAGEGHALGKRKKVSPVEMVDQPWVWFSEAVTGRQFFAQWLQSVKLAAPVSAVETTSLQSGFRLMQRNRHVMLLPSTLAPLAAEFGLVRLRTAATVGRYVSGLMYRPSVLRLRAFEEFRARLLELALPYGRLKAGASK